jgi:hypothetical protein
MRLAPSAPLQKTVKGDSSLHESRITNSNLSPGLEIDAND